MYMPFFAKKKALDLLFSMKFVKFYTFNNIFIWKQHWNM